MHQAAPAPATAPDLPPPRRRGFPYGALFLRRIFVFGPVLVLTSLAVFLMADLLWRVYGFFNGAFLVLLVLFALLFALLCLGAMTALAGFFRPWCRTRRVSLGANLAADDLQMPFARTAVVCPVYNENPEEIFERLRAIYRSLERTGRIEDFHFFVLSDSTSPDNWSKEEYAWAALCAEFGAFGRIFYRRRQENTNKKAGNIADFCQTWGGHYAYMLVLDADSLMAGEDIVKMVALMQKHPRVGLLQTAPRLIGGESVHGRIQQFAYRLYGDLFTAGLNFWQGPDGNYWGHNALIRLAPFIDCCALPDLPGREPFGGKILSHDFVEAALMRRLDWEVWLLWDLEGTYEGGPQSLVDSAKRDRRWLQGNLQHTWLIFASGLRQMSRFHLVLGIMGYLASALWFLFLFLFTVVEVNLDRMGLSLVPGESRFSQLASLSVFRQGQILFGATLVLLFLPKTLALLEALFSPGRLRSFGGAASLFAGILLETLYSALTAPVVMLFHAKFVFFLLLGKKVEWVTQQRDAIGTGWREAAASHGSQSLLAALWLTVAFLVKPVLAIGLLPVFGPVLFAIPLSVWSSRPGPGQTLRRFRILATPEELRPPRELDEIERRRSVRQSVLSARFDPESPREGITRAIVDPYVNAVHVSLMQRHDEAAPATVPESMRTTAERLLAEGPLEVDDAALRKVASDPDLLLELHRRIWITPFAELAPWWQDAVEVYRRHL